MTITVVCDVLGEENNGTTVATMNLIRHLQQFGHNVKVLCADSSKIGQENYYVVPNMNLGKFLNAYVKKAGVSLAKADEQIIRQALQGTEHVHLMLPFGLSMATLKIAKNMGLSITAGFHMQAENLTSYVFLNKVRLANNLVYKFINKHVYKYVDGIHYPTKFIRDLFESQIKQNTPGYVISNGVHAYVKKRENEKPDELKDKIVILSTGRYAREKSQDTLIKAIKYSKYKEKIQLILAGQGIKEKAYKKLAKSLPVAPIFKLYQRNDLIDVLNYSDIYVHPAEVELEGIACLEAIACGKLTIVSDSKLSATKNYAIDEKCIFKKRNSKDLARVIDYWIENPEERKIYEDKYLLSAKNFSLEECMIKMEKMIVETHSKKLNSKEN